MFQTGLPKNKTRKIARGRLEMKMSKTIRKTRFSVVDIVIIIAIAAILMAMAVPLYNMLTM